MRLYGDHTHKNKVTCNSIPKHFTFFLPLIFTMHHFNDLCFVLIFHHCHHTLYVRGFPIKFSINILLGTLRHVLLLKFECRKVISQSAQSGHVVRDINF